MTSKHVDPLQAAISRLDAAQQEAMRKTNYRNTAGRIYTQASAAYNAALDACTAALRAGQPTDGLNTRRDQLLEAEQAAHAILKEAQAAETLAITLRVNLEDEVKRLRAAADNSPEVQAAKARTGKVVRPQPRTNGPAPVGRIRSMLGL